MEASSQLDDVVSNVLRSAGKLHELVKQTQKAYLDIQEELDRVKQNQKTYLKELDRIKFENNRLEKANDILSRQLESYQQLYPKTRTIELPHEILLVIFRRAAVPSWLLNRTDSLEASHSVVCCDLRMKMSIMGVCKNWHQIGIELLYENVTLRRIGQLPAFVRTLEGHEGLGARVCHLNITCFVPIGYSHLLQWEIKNILMLCPRLVHIAFNPPLPIPTLPYFLPPISSTITSLEYGWAVDFSIVLPALVQLCGTLKSLSFTPPPLHEDVPKLVLENLEDLHLHDYTMPSSRWKMPRLRRFWSTGRTWLPHEVTVWFNSYGPTLRFVSWRSGNNHIGEILNRCPALEHVVVGRPVQGFTSSVVETWKHDTLQSLDIWEQYSKFSAPPSVTVDWKKVFPALRTSRTLDDTFGYLVDLPIRTPPYAVEQGALGSPSLPENIQEDPMAIVREFIHPESVDGNTLGSTRAFAHIDRESEDGDSSSDDEYVDDSEDDGGSVDSDNSDSDSGSCLTVSEGDLSELDESWEVDRAQALDIFSGTLDSD